MQKRLKTHVQHGITQFELSKKILNNLSQFNLKPITKLVLLYLCDCYNPNKAEMFPKQSTIAEKLGVSEASVIRAVSELHKEGLIVSERKGNTNRYKFTSKIVCECPQNIFSCQKEMQDENNQNEILETCKMQPHEHEQKRETNKPTNVEYFKILKNYAVQKGAKNVNAYINYLIKSGAATEIIQKAKQAKINARAMENSTKKVIEDLAFAKANRAEKIPQCWYDMKAKILNIG